MNQKKEEYELECKRKAELRRLEVEHIVEERLKEKARLKKKIKIIVAVVVPLLCAAIAFIIVLNTVL